MDPFVVITHAEPVRLEARPVEHDGVPVGYRALGFFAGGRLIARSVMPPAAADPLAELLRDPVIVALAATEDEHGNIDGRVCIVLPVTQDRPVEEGGEAGEPWKSSVPDLPPGIESADGPDASQRLALLPIGNVVRPARNRRHEDLASDVREMLGNLLAGRGEDAVARAIDDLLDSI